MQTYFNDFKISLNRGYEIWRKHLWRCISYPIVYFMFTIIGELLMDNVLILHYLKEITLTGETNISSIINYVFAIIVMISFFETLIEVEDENKNPDYIKEFFVEDKMMGKSIVFGISLFTIFFLIRYVINYAPNNMMSYDYDYEYYSVIYKTKLIISSINAVIYTLLLFSPIIIVASDLSVKDAILESKRIISKRFFYYLVILLFCSTFLYDLSNMLLSLLLYDENIIKIINYRIGVFTIYDILSHIINTITWSFLGCLIYALYENREIIKDKIFIDKIEEIGVKEEE